MFTRVIYACDFISRFVPDLETLMFDYQAINILKLLNEMRHVICLRTAIAGPIPMA